MKIRAALLTVVLGAFTLTVTAQDNSSKCREGFAALQAKAFTKSYDDVLALLPELRKSCPKFDERLYTYGEAAYKYKVESARTEADARPYTEELLAFYGEQQKNFPASGGNVKKAVFLHDRKLTKDDEVYKLLDGEFTAHRQGFTDYAALELYYNLLLERYESGDKGVTQDIFIEKYGEIAAQVNYAKSGIEAKRASLEAKHKTTQPEPEEIQYLEDTKYSISALDAVSDNIRKQSSKYISCEKLEANYEKTYESFKADAARLEGMVIALYDTKCYQSALLLKGAEQWYKLQQTVTSAYYLGSINIRLHKTKEALVYFDRMADLEKDPARKSEAYIKIAGIYRNVDMAEAQKYAQKAIDANAKSGKAYLLLAEMYAHGATPCKLTDFDKKALNWLAVDMAKKAAVAEPKFKAAADAAVKEYSANLPTAADLKTAKKKKGDTIEYGCWINRTVTVPNVK
jgi:hypothetical protein